MVETPIVTLTLNPAWDVIHLCPDWREQRLVRATEARTVPGGKGVNVSRVLIRLGSRSRCLVVTGEEDREQFCRALAMEGIDVAEYPIPGLTRKNITLIDNTCYDELHSVAPGISADHDALAGLPDWLAEQGVSGAMFVLAGSLPPGAAPQLAGELIAVARESGMTPVIDTHGKALEVALRQGPWGVKVNVGELAEVVGLTRASDEHELVAAARKLISQCGLAWVCLTHGKKGAVLVTADQCLFATPPPVRTLQTTGCGDGFLAGLLWALSRGENFPTALTWATAVAAAVAEVAEVGLVRKERVDALRSQTRTRQWS